MSWTTTEDAVLIYYTSREVPPDIISSLIALKCHRTHTILEMNDGLKEIRRHEIHRHRPDLCLAPDFPGGPGAWDLPTVDRWLNDLANVRITGGVRALVALLRYGGAAKRVVIRVCDGFFCVLWEMC